VLAAAFSNSDREGTIVPVRVKICGLTRPEDTARAAAAGAWALGVVFAPESPRRVTPEQAAQVFAAAPPEVEKVGVFVNAPESEIIAAVTAAGLTAVQLHGEESAEFCARVAQETGVTVIKAVRVSGPGSLAGVVQFDTGFVLLDTYNPERRGGTGETFDWKLAAELPEETRSGRLILSGGLNPENVTAALDAVGPYALDVSSGIESAPGIKDPGRLEQLFDILREREK
jgi:phosphoribosylanthranilate isomerase